MPTYVFRDKNTGVETEKFMKISELDQYLIDNPHLEQGVCGTIAHLDSVRLGIRKPDDSFRDILRRIKKHNHGSNLNTF